MKPHPPGREGRNFGLRCACGGASHVLDSRTCRGGVPDATGRPAALPYPYRRRRHECRKCGARWSTLEVREADLLDADNTPTRS